MNKDKLQLLVKETVNEELLRESLADLEVLRDGISSSTMVGKPWFNLIINLESVINEVKDFRSSYSTTFHGPPPNITLAMQQLQGIVKSLEIIKPVIMGMDDIERKDV